MTIGHPVGDLDLEAMVPPDGTWVTDGVLDGVGPYSFTPSLALVRGRPGVVHVAFLCLDIPGFLIGADYTWFGQTSVMFCDSGPHTRAVFTFDLDNSAKTVLPQIELPAGATWQLIAWLAPPSHQPAAGTSAGGTGLDRFTGYGLTFTYPRSWHSLTPAQPSAYHATTLAFRAPRRCATPARKRPEARRRLPCDRAPVAALPPDGVLVDWSMTRWAASGTGMRLGRPAGW